MLKQLDRDDVQVTPFIATKKWNLQNINLDNLILWMSGSLSGSISHMYMDYGDGTSAPFVNTSCSLALLQMNPSESVQYHRGLNITGTFFPHASEYYSETANPVNQDRTYKRMVYSSHKQLFYNTREDPSQLLGLENINLSSSNRSLTDVMDVFSLTKNQLGEKIIPNSVVIKDSQFDQVYTIIDDGHTNLVLSGSYFNQFQELSL